MANIFVDQTYLRIRLTTGVNITGSLRREIHYVKPDNTTGHVDASVEDMIQGIIYYDVPVGSTLFDQAGTWKCWSFIEFADGRTARGTTHKEVIRINSN